MADNNNTLHVDIDSNVDGLKKGLTQADKALKGFDTKAKSLTKQLEANTIASSILEDKTGELNAQFKSGSISLKKYEEEIKSVTLRENQLSASSKKLSADLLKVNKSTRLLGGTSTKAGKAITANAVPAMTSFSQIVQDAPFGIQGVANNITQLTMQFGNLSKKTGGASLAMKGMLTTLAGPAGILLAVSVVTSLMVSYGDEMSALTSKGNELGAAFKKASEEIGIQISKLNQLTTALEDSNTSEEDKIRIIAKLRKDYPDYLGKLALNTVSHKELTKAINQEKTALIGLGITRALEAKKAPLYAKIASLSLKTDLELGTASVAGVASEESRRNLGESKRKLLEDSYKKQLDRVNESIKKTVAKYEFDSIKLLGLGKVSNDGINELLDFSEEYDLFLLKLSKGGKGKKTDDGFSAFKAQVDAARKAREQEAKEYKKGQQELVNSLERKEEAIENWEDQRLDKMFKASAERLAIGARGNATELALYDAFVNSSKSKILTFSQWKNTQQGIEQQKTLSSLIQFNDGIRDIIENSLAGTFAGIGEAIGMAFADGGNILQAGIMAITNGMAGLLSAMGDYLIKAGTAAVLAGTITKLFGSIAGVGAGIAAIAGGTLLKALSSGIKGCSGAGGGGGASAGGTNHSRQTRIK